MTDLIGVINIFLLISINVDCQVTDVHYTSVIEKERLNKSDEKQSPMRPHIGLLDSIFQNARTIIFVNHLADWDVVDHLTRRKVGMLYDQRILNDFCDYSSNATNDNDDEFFLEPDEDLPIFSKKIFKNQNVAYIIEIPLKMLANIETCVIHSRQTYFFTIAPEILISDNGNTTVLEITKVLKTAWHKLGAINVFILWNNTIYSYDPLGYDELREGNDGFGVIMKNDSKLFSWDKLKSVDGFPMTVDLFYSAYISAIYADKNETILIRYVGADYEVMKTIQERLNFTCKLILSYFQKKTNDCLENMK
jgi:hypothetical protein